MIQLTYFSHLLQDEMNHTLKVPISLYWLLKESRVTASDADVSVIDFVLCWMNLTIRAYRFWHIFTFFHNFLLKTQLPWKNRGDTHTFVSGAIYCRMAGKLTLCVWNVDILMKKSTSKIMHLRKKIFLCGNTDMWPHVNDRSVLQASNLHYRTPFLPGLHIPGFIPIPSIGDSCWWSSF